MAHSGEVIADLSPAMQDMMVAASTHQRAIAPAAAEALWIEALSPGLDRQTRNQAITILDNYAVGRLVEEGFENVPLSSGFGQGVLPSDVSALMTYRVPVLGSPNKFGMRPTHPENRANYVAFLAINGLGVEQMVAFNTAGTGSHVAEISHEDEGSGGLTVVGDRILPADGEGEKLTADAAIMTNPSIEKGLVGTNADIPIVVGTAGEAIFAVNGGWHNLAAGVDITFRRKLAELGLLNGPVHMAIGPAAREGFEISHEKLIQRSRMRDELGGDPRSYHAATGITEHPDPRRANLELTHWAQITVGAAAVRGGIVSMDLCTIDGAKAGYLHSSRVHRPHPTVQGEMAAGDRGMTAIVPSHIRLPITA